VPRTLVGKGHIESVLTLENDLFIKPSARMVWLGPQPFVHFYKKTKKGNTLDLVELTFHAKKETLVLKIEEAQGRWLAGILPKLSVSQPELLSFQQVQADYEEAGLSGFEEYWYEKWWDRLHAIGLLAV
jgi:hypothetical protein